MCLFMTISDSATTLRGTTKLPAPRQAFKLLLASPTKPAKSLRPTVEGTAGRGQGIDCPGWRALLENQFGARKSARTD
jgi:hypothetical protein